MTSTNPQFKLLRRRKIEVITLLISLLALVFAYQANIESSRQAAITAVEAQITSCFAISQTYNNPNGIGDTDAVNAIHKSAALSRCLAPATMKRGLKFRDCVEDVQSDKGYTYKDLGHVC